MSEEETARTDLKTVNRFPFLLPLRAAAATIFGYVGARCLGASPDTAFYTGLVSGIAVSLYSTKKTEKAFRRLFVFALSPVEKEVQNLLGSKLFSLRPVAAEFERNAKKFFKESLKLVSLSILGGNVACSFGEALMKQGGIDLGSPIDRMRLLIPAIGVGVPLLGTIIYGKLFQEFLHKTLPPLFFGTNSDQKQERPSTTNRHDPLKEGRKALP